LQRVVVSSEGPGYSALEFHTPVFSTDGYFSCVATLIEDSEESSTDVEMIEPYRYDMLGFFEEMAAEAAGWVGTKKWQSELATLSVAAVNADGHTVSFEVGARRPPDLEESLGLVLNLPTVELEELARKLRAFLDLPHGERFQPVGAEP